MIPLESAMREKCGKKCRKNGNYHMEENTGGLYYSIPNISSILSISRRLCSSILWTYVSIVNATE